MRRNILKLAVIATAVVMASCGGGTPKGIVNDLYSALQKGDYKKAAKIELENTWEYAELSKEMRDAFIPLVAEEMREYAEEHYAGGMKSFKITRAEGDDVVYGIEMDVTDKSGYGRRNTVIFEKKDGKWWLLEEYNENNWR